MTRTVVFPFIVSVVVFFAALPAMVSAQTIVDIAAENDDFSTLVELVVTAELAEVLSGEDEFTVFAPTNEAFANLMPFAAEAIERNPDLISDILLYHVVPGTLMAEDVLASDELEAAQEEILQVSMMDDQPMINSANITQADIEASNGVIHVIDEVLIPESVYVDALTQIRDALAALLMQLQMEAGMQSATY